MQGRLLLPLILGKSESQVVLGFSDAEKIFSALDSCYRIVTIFPLRSSAVSLKKGPST